MMPHSTSFLTQEGNVLPERCGIDQRSVATTSKLSLNELQERLRTRFIGRTVFFSKKVGSTNEWARELADQGALEGTVAIAETQTHGRGRLERRWISPRGGLWFSVILRPRISLTETPQLAFVAGLAVAKALHESYGLETETKWPNDVLVKGRKVCGILGEAGSTDWKVNSVVLGVGVNANFDTRRVLPAAIRPHVTSLEKELGRRVQLEELFCTLLEKLEVTYDIYSRKGFASVLEEWKKHALFLGREVEVADRYKRIVGVAYDVSQDGALVLKLKDGMLKRFFAGDLSLLTKQQTEEKWES